MELSKLQKKRLARLTKFQQAVLLACSSIPAGKTKTYSQLATSIGRPRAARAVGNALAINPFAPLIPCHRVIRSDGKLGGYSGKGGAKTKRRLLEREMETNI
jgi:O-6-methylguanine DNA methyltransferase